MPIITGNTYPVKDALKALGARWNADAKGWQVPESKAAEAQALVANAPPPAPRVPGKCAKCGGKCKPEYVICWNCKTGGSRSNGFGGRFRQGDGGPRGHKECYMCGSYYCEGARGGLCEED